MKKYIMICCVALVAAAMVTGSIAYFTDSVETKNVIASGNIDIRQHEYERKMQDGAYTDQLQPYTQAKEIFPCGLTAESPRGNILVDGHEVAMYDGTVPGFIDKIVNVENTGKNLAYVRTFVAVPAQNGEEWLHMDKSADANWVWSDQVIADQEIDGLLYDIHMATYQKQLNPGDVTSPAILGFYLDGGVGNKDAKLTFNGKTVLDTQKPLTILVFSEGSQAHSDIFPDSDTALNTTFGQFEMGHHPWRDVLVAYNQEELNKALNNARYDTEIALMDGEYILPETLPDGVRLMGWGEKVELTAQNGVLNAYDVEIDNASFTAALSFTGHGSFQDVTFEKELTALCNNISAFCHCAFQGNCSITGDQVTFEDCTILSACTGLEQVDGVTVIDE